MSAPILDYPSRRTHSVHHTRKEAIEAARDLGGLMNGVPCGYGFFIIERMGKFAFVSIKLDEFES